jgi:hypothetical protein
VQASRQAAAKAAALDSLFAARALAAHQQYMQAGNRSRRSKGRRVNRNQKKRDHSATLSPPVADILATAVMATSTGCEVRWMLDSGASTHMAAAGTELTNTIVDSRVQIRIADGTALTQPTRGSMYLRTNNSGVEMLLQNVLTHPRLKSNLLSVSAICRAQGSVRYYGNEALAYDNTGRLLFIAKASKDGVYYLDAVVSPPNQQAFVMAAVTQDSLKQYTKWHHRMCHLSHSGMDKVMKSKCVSGVENTLRIGAAETTFCSGCVRGKAHRHNYKRRIDVIHHATYALHRVHCDIAGPYAPTIEGYRYMLVFVDEFTRWTHVVPLTHKSEAGEAIVMFCRQAAQRHRRHVTEFHSDNAKEFRTRRVAEYFAAAGTEQTWTTVYTPQHNGIVERMNRTLVEGARSMLEHAKAPVCLWAYAISAMSYTRNRVAVLADGITTPQTLWEGKPYCNIGHLRVFGCDAHVLYTAQPRPEYNADTFTSKTWTGILVGYDAKNKAYLVLDTSRRTSTPTISRDVMLDETSFEQMKKLAPIEGYERRSNGFGHDEDEADDDADDGSGEAKAIDAALRESELEARRRDAPLPDIDNDDDDKGIAPLAVDADAGGILGDGPTPPSTPKSSSFETPVNHPRRRHDEVDDDDDDENDNRNNDDDPWATSNPLDDRVRDRFVPVPMSSLDAASTAPDDDIYVSDDESINEKRNRVRRRVADSDDEAEDSGDVSDDHEEQKRPARRARHAAADRGLSEKQIREFDAPLVREPSQSTREQHPRSAHGRLKFTLMPDDYASAAVTHSMSTPYDDDINTDDDLGSHQSMAALVSQSIATATKQNGSVTVTFHQKKNTQAIAKSKQQQRHRSKLDAAAALPASQPLHLPPGHHHREQLYQAVAYAARVSLDMPYDSSDPLSYKEAMQRSDQPMWQQSVDKELASLKSHGTYEFVQQTGRMNVIGCRWVFKRKFKSDGSVERYKARLVAKGYRQREGIDYAETYAPVLHYKSLRVLLSIIASLDYEMKQMDVPTAFLNADLTEDVYMEVPEGLVDAPPKGTVCHLLKSLYGIKQAPRAWNLEINGFLMSIGYSRMVSDTCMYVKRSRTGRMIIVPLFVDDIFPACHKLDLAEMLADMKLVMTKYDIPVLDEADMVLGMRIRRDRANRTVHLDQQLYIEKICGSHGLLDGKIALTPEAQNVEQKALKLDLEREEAMRAGKSVKPEECADVQLYGQMVGQLLYCALSSRPDIAHACSVLARTLGRLLARHAQQARRCFRYLSHTRTVALKFGGGPVSDSVILGTSYSDSDWGGDPLDRKSTTGYIVKINNDTCVWQSKKQATVALSTAEAEYMAMSAATTEIVWVRSLLKELGFEQTTPSLLLCDNKPATNIAMNDAHHGRTKHIDLRHHFLRQHILDGDLKVAWIATEYQQADILTKALSVEIFSRLRDAVMSKTDVIVRR